MPAARKNYRKDFLNFFLPVSLVFPALFSGADSAAEEKIRTALFLHPGKRNGIFSGSRIIFDLYFMIYQIYSSFSQHLVNKVL